MTLEILIADAVERGVLAAMSKLNMAPAAPLESSSPTTVAAEPAATKKSGRSKKAEAVSDTTAEVASVITDTPLPPPAPAPSSVTVDDIEADRAKLITLTSKIEDGRKVATELIRQHGPKFDALTADVRAGILTALESRVPA